MVTVARVFLIFDGYHENSIKNCTRYGRLSSVCAEIDLKLSAPLPTQNTLLKFSKNKIKLIRLLVEYISLNLPHTLNKKLIITASDPTPVEIFKGVITERRDLYTRHEEADVIIPHQVISAIGKGSSCVRVLSDDTDVFVLLLHYLLPIDQDVVPMVQMDSPKTEERDRALINIMKTGLAHKPIIPHLLAAHSLLGNDTVPKLFGIGKNTVLKILKSHPSQRLGDENQTIDDVMQESRAFIAACYGFNSFTNTSFTEIR